MSLQVKWGKLGKFVLIKKEIIFKITMFNYTNWTVKMKICIKMMNNKIKINKN